MVGEQEITARFKIVAAFDVEPRRKCHKEIKQPIHGRDKLREFTRTRGVKTAILTVFAVTAREGANLLVNPGIAGILNFLPIVLSLSEEVVVNNVNLAIEPETGATSPGNEIPRAGRQFRCLLISALDRRKTVFLVCAVVERK